MSNELACRCGYRKTLTKKFWCSVFEPEDIAKLVGRQEAATIDSVPTLGGAARIYGCGVRRPRCEACNVIFEIDQIAGGLRACTQCRGPIEVREADDLCREICPQAKWVVSPPSNRKYPTFYMLCEFDDATRLEARWADAEVRERDARTDKLTVEQYERLARDPEEDVRKEVAKNHAAPASALAILARDREREIKLALLQNPSTSGATFAELVGDGEEEVRRAALKSARITAELLATRVGDRDSDVRQLVVKHPQVTPAILAALARDPHYRVRAEVAKNPATPAEALEHLARDTDSDVMRAFESNPVLTPELIAQLRNPR